SSRYSRNYSRIMHRKRSSRDICARGVGHKTSVSSGKNEVSCPEARCIPRFLAQQAHPTTAAGRRDLKESGDRTKPDGDPKPSEIFTTPPASLARRRNCTNNFYHEASGNLRTSQCLAMIRPQKCGQRIARTGAKRSTSFC